MILLKNEIAKTQKINFQNQLGEFFEKYQKEYSKKFSKLLDELSGVITTEEIQVSLSMGELVAGIRPRFEEVLRDFANENLGELCSVALQTVLKDLDKRLPDLDISQVTIEDLEQAVIDNFVESMSEQQVKALNEAIKYCNTNTRIDQIPKEEITEIIKYGSALNSVLLKSSINYFAAQKESTTSHRAKTNTKRVINEKKQYRAQVLSTDEILWNYRSAEKRSIEAGMEQGVFHGVVKRWLSAGDNRVCDICRQLNKKVIEFDETFDLEDGTVISDTNGAHSLCRCVVQYIEKELYELGIY